MYEGCSSSEPVNQLVEDRNIEDLFTEVKYEKYICVFQKIIKTNPGVANSISHEYAKYQFHIICILGYTEKL